MAGDQAILKGSGFGLIAKHSIYNYDYVLDGSQPEHTVGDRLQLTDGRVFYYAYNCDAVTTGTAAALAPGIMTTGSPPVANHRNMAVSAAAAKGAMKVYVTPGATAGGANFYAGGYLHFDTGGSGYARYYKVKSHLAIGSATAFWINLYDPLETAITVATKATLTANPWANLVIYPATNPTSIPTGIPLITVPQSTSAGRYYFWCQTWGPCACLCNTTMGIGTPLGVSGTAGSALTVAADASAQWGVQLNPNATTTYSLVYLTIAP